MKKFLTYLCIFLLVSLILARFFLCQMRWSDRKALRVFHSRNIPIRIHDTVINERHLHYVVTGNDSLPSLVFIHGSPGSWMHYMRYLRDTALLKRFRLIGIDRPGYGHSDYGKPMRLQAQCAIILPVLQTLKTDKPMFAVGHSYGGPTVAQLAADAPGLFKTIVLAAGALDPALEKKETWRHVMENKPLNLFLPGAFKQSNTELLWLKEDLLPLAKDLAKITCNVMIIHGDKDTWVPIENIAYDKKMLVNAHILRIDTIHGAKHQVPWKHRKEFRNLLLSLE